MTRRVLIFWLALGLASFAAADHLVRPAPDHTALEAWRSFDVGGACAPCGAVCDDKK